MGRVAGGMIRAPAGGVKVGFDDLQVQERGCLPSLVPKSEGPRAP